MMTSSRPPRWSVAFSRRRRPVPVLLATVACALVLLGGAGCSCLRRGRVCEKSPRYGDLWEWKEEDNWAKEEIREQIEGNILYIVGLLLSHSEEEEMSEAPNIVFVFRDTRISAHQRVSIWRNGDMVEYFRGVRDNPARAEWEYKLVEWICDYSGGRAPRRFGDLVGLVRCIDLDAVWDRFTRTLIIGPPDLICPDGKYGRRVYQLPAEREWWDSRICDNECFGQYRVQVGFDAETGLLVLIGEKRYLAMYDQLLAALGAKQVPATQDPVR